MSVLWIGEGLWEVVAYKSWLPWRFTVIARPVERGGDGCTCTAPPTEPSGPPFLADQLLPTLSLTVLFLFLILCSENAPKHLLRRLLTEATDGLLPITRGRSQILFLLKEIVVCIVPFCVALLSLRVV